LLFTDFLDTVYRWRMAAELAAPTLQLRLTTGIFYASVNTNEWSG